MSADDPQPAGEELQFDRAVSSSPAAADATAKPMLACKACSKPIQGEYYQINGKVTCASCRTAIEAAVATPNGVHSFVRALGMGIIAAFAGAALYYGVAKITGFVIGIVAIACGYMVGWAVRKGAGDRGGRRFQILAIILTYWSVGLAYAPALEPPSLLVDPITLLNAFRFPIVVVTSGRIITGFVIAFGMFQAWQMTAAPTLKIAGPFRVGSGPTPAAA
jgi:hypothetical protein